MSVDLLPCPFCGSTKVDDYFIRDGRMVACGCGASMRAFQPDATRKAREAWNRRAALSNVAQPLSSERRSGSDSAPATDTEIIFSPPTEEEGEP